MLNHIVIMGRLTRDPELRRTQSGVDVASFTLAVERDFTDRATGRKETDFIDCVGWRQTAEFVSKWFKKGQMMAVEGRLQSREYTDKAGAKRKAWEIQADRCFFAGAARTENAAGAQCAPQRNEDPSSAARSAAPSPEGEGFGGVSGFAEMPDDGELPF